MLKDLIKLLTNWLTDKCIRGGGWPMLRVLPDMQGDGSGLGLGSFLVQPFHEAVTQNCEWPGVRG